MTSIRPQKPLGKKKPETASDSEEEDQDIRLKDFITIFKSDEVSDHVINMINQEVNSRKAKQFQQKQQLIFEKQQSKKDEEEPDFARHHPASPNTHFPDFVGANNTGTSIGNIGPFEYESIRQSEKPRERFGICDLDSEEMVRKQNSRGDMIVEIPILENNLASPYHKKDPNN
mmetsp:Transcript_5889/g.9540  ORF Transcript_5889/g.9540 Transcript_5889/m.9540 type:complete len:173 (-) Transcript_5889:2045-2563(-)